MTNNEALQRIRNAKDKTDLDLSCLGLESLPAEIKSLTSLTKLILSHNKLNSLPSEIAELKNLENLHLSFNNLKYFPIEIANLNNLKVLELNSNYLESVPPEIGKLTKLEKLNLNDNKLKILPLEINLPKLTSILVCDKNDLEPKPPNCETEALKKYYNNPKHILEKEAELQKRKKKIEEREKALEEMESKKWKDDVKPAWVEAQKTMENYHNRNFSQIKFIFKLSIAVMIIGFGFILYGISKGTLNSLAAGIITEFIGATFLVVYRSTIQQASTYYKTLEKENFVGIALEIVDTISVESKELKDKTKTEIIKSLLSSPETK
ncbi:leucine-rich repeat domain-containing protein [bacterium]|nr:leucine-rich repeat domain-containing protein [bacterium]